MVQLLELHASTAGGLGLIPGRRANIPQDAQHHQKKKKEWEGLHSKILIKIKFWSKQTNERDLTPICLLGKKRLTVLLYDMYVKYQNTTYTLRK